MSDAEAIAKRFKVKIDLNSTLIQSNEFNGFSHPKCSIITNQDPMSIENSVWGMLPAGSKNRNTRSYTLNARIETLQRKPSFKHAVNNRCLILADGYYEWKDVIIAGKKRKVKYLITGTDGLPFLFAGLYVVEFNEYDNIQSKSFSIVTTNANEVVAKIHSKKRMPVIVKDNDVENWLNCGKFEYFAYPYSYDLSAKPLFGEIKKKEGEYPSLF